MRLPFLALALAAGPALAEPFVLGGDVVVGDETAATPASARDLFAAGPSVRLAEPVEADVHVAGFSVSVEAATGQDLYAAGGDVEARAAVGDDLTAVGFSVVLGEAARVGGNARLAGGSVRVEGAVAGALLASGGSVRLDAPVGGDAWIVAEEVAFGPGARVDGTLHLETAEPVDVPGTVAPAERVTQVRLEGGRGRPGFGGWPGRWTHGWGGGMGAWHGWGGPGRLALSGAAVVVLAFLLVLGLGIQAVAPGRVEAMRARAARRPAMSLALGVAGLSALVGLVPVSAMTIVGLPLVPLVLLGILLAWTLAYLLGAYTVAMGLLGAGRGTGAAQGPGLRAAALALGLVIAALLNFVPVLGWIANFALMLLGLGALTAGLVERLAPAPIGPVGAPPEAA